VRQPFNAAVGAGDGGRDGLLDFVCQRRGHLPQNGYSIDVCQIVLELTQSLALSFGTFAIFNVREGSVPFNNVSLLVPEWGTTHQKPAIFPVSGATEPRLVFEKLSGCNRDAPLFRMAHKIFRMDRTLPTCA